MKWERSKLRVLLGFNEDLRFYGKIEKASQKRVLHSRLSQPDCKLKRNYPLGVFCDIGIV